MQICDISLLFSRQYDRLEKLVEQCCFQLRDMSTSEYHPLSLKVLGSQVGLDTKGWQILLRSIAPLKIYIPSFLF